MHIKTLNIEEFENFEKNHPLSSLYQTVNYGMLKAEIGYDYELIGLLDEENTIIAASLILIKSIGTQSYYGYAPRGFLIDYQNDYLLDIFTKKLKEYYLNKRVIFIKVNPNIPIGEVNLNNYSTTYNDNYQIKNNLINYDFKKLFDNLYFEAQLPRFNAFVNLKNYDPSKLNKNTRNKIKKGIRKGLVFEKAEKNDIQIFEKLLNNKDIKEFYYQDYYTAFEKNNAVDLFLISIDYDEFLQNSQYIYNKELEKNNKLNERLTRKNTEHNINAKMASDKALLSYKNDIMEASKGLSDNHKVYLAGALVVKHNNVVTVVMNAYDKNYKRFAPNYFLYYNIIKYYQEKYEFLDLNGVVGDFKNNNPYSGLNRFKIGFNPRIFEYIGEYDFIINPKMYEILNLNGYLAKEFNKKTVS